jgi:hypothetical protein
MHGSVEFLTKEWDNSQNPRYYHRLDGIHNMLMFSIMALHVAFPVPKLTDSVDQVMKGLVVSEGHRMSRD